ncbi:uncharacterized protein BDR25DRAFT_381794 [Lindgomyces ingoldianus]|uniref:Uncharacterized protein n=1 Tax=Lindgomyces ingoldianus TaxID=673940 RepID=A0ACB6QDA3_9PLEO|nr:uncharacterized protein BDR25DRAFT_381794 [Lindgomyces ingoldianus]KAF2464120.1 hypothetical protein BDR25DRAFT_381794 [Lindgomyces ingoldianus]
MMICDFVECFHYHDVRVHGSRPVLTGAAAEPTFAELSSIDMSRLLSSDILDRNRLEEVGIACRDVGSFYAVNNEIPDHVCHGTFEDIACIARRGRSGSPYQ